MVKMTSKTQTFTDYLSHKFFSPHIEYTCKKERFGSQYGGWDIAIEHITSTSVIYSFGIGTDASFDTEIINHFNVTIHAFDPTPKSIEWFKKQHFPQNLILHEYGLADFDGDIRFNPPENPDHVSHTILDRQETKDRAIMVKVKNIATIMKELGHEKLDVLKMDIEGAEYQVIEDLVFSRIYPTQILVEFHHRFPNVGLRKTKKAMKTLNRIGYRLFSVSSSKEEFCFIRNQ
jgi:FkbM family methyltransferase